MFLLSPNVVDLAKRYMSDNNKQDYHALSRFAVLVRHNDVTSACILVIATIGGTFESCRSMFSFVSIWLGLVVPSTTGGD